MSNVRILVAKFVHYDQIYFVCALSSDDRCRVVGVGPIYRLGHSCGVSLFGL